MFIKNPFGTSVQFVRTTSLWQAKSVAAGVTLVSLYPICFIFSHFPLTSTLKFLICSMLFECMAPSRARKLLVPCLGPNPCGGMSGAVLVGAGLDDPLLSGMTVNFGCFNRGLRGLRPIASAIAFTRSLWPVIHRRLRFLSSPG
jgi:hypothetical protein